MLIIDHFPTFIMTISNAGITAPKEIIPDGQLHRFSSNGKPNDSAGYYGFFQNANGFCAGYFGCWRTGIYSTWSSKYKSTWTDSERKYVEDCQKAAELARKKGHENRALYAQELWTKAEQVTNGHGYLAKKQLKDVKGVAYMPKISCRDFFMNESNNAHLHNVLLIPVFDENNSVQSLQAISPEGKKFFMSGGKMVGGRMTISGNTDTVYLCEGYATGMSLHQLTNDTVVVAFNAANLKSIAPSLPELYPESTIIIAADNDHIKEKEGKGNKGLEVAKYLYEKHQLPYTFPPFDSQSTGTDWNDYCCVNTEEDALAALKDSLVEPPVVYDSFEECIKSLEDDQDNEHAFNSAIKMISEASRLKATRMRNQLKKASGADIGEIRTAVKDVIRSQQKPELTHGQIADKYLEMIGKPHPVGVYGRLWDYYPMNGIWSDDALSTVGVAIAKQFSHEAKCVRGSDYKAIASHAYDTVADEDFFADAPAGINTPSGFIHADGKALKLSPPNPEHRAQFRLEIDPVFDKEPTKFLTMLSEAFAGEYPEEQIRQLRMLTGMTLLGLLPPEQRAVLLVGEAGSGKSVYLRIIEALVPSQYRTSISPLDWDSDYKVAALAGKLINLVPEIDKHKPIPSAQFKAIIGGDTVSAREPYEKVFSFTPSTACLFNGNFFPTTKDYTEGFWRRWAIIRFVNTKPAHERNPKLCEELILEELPAILWWALEGAEDYLVNGLYLSSAHSKALDKWKNNGNSVASWLQDHEDNEIGEREQRSGRQPLKVMQAYIIYKDWCQRTNRKPFNKQEFKEQMIMQGYVSTVYCGYSCYTALFNASSPVLSTKAYA
ncbi:hypothetical protein BCT07_10855 [Vibrio breoganii]|uniref:phage/plasmid primase, P4 family n=1 Tax=Vibrio breoganii TaxID=553239 RepID=UPI000C85BBB9|nr:phage/plasmid primase, P4 family [Vibrio breoganii]PMO58745.1 hypothetical protein BCT07_10855 [Vibrio breoganii]